MTAGGQSTSGLQPGRPGTDDENAVVVLFRGDILRMPAAPPFLAHSWVLGAAHRRGQKIAGDADVTADTFAYVFDSALVDLVWQERIGNRGPCCADQVKLTTFDQ